LSAAFTAPLEAQPVATTSGASPSSQTAE